MRTGLGSTQSTESLSGVPARSSVQPEVTTTFSERLPGARTWAFSVRIRSEAVLHLGNAQIHDDDFGVDFFEEGDRPGARLRDSYLMPRLFEDKAVELQKLQVVVDQKQTAHGIETRLHYLKRSSS